MKGMNSVMETPLGEVTGEDNGAGGLNDGCGCILHSDGVELECCERVLAYEASRTCVSAKAQHGLLHVLLEDASEPLEQVPITPLRSMLLYPVERLARVRSPSGLCEATAASGHAMPRYLTSRLTAVGRKHRRSTSLMSR